MIHKWSFKAASSAIACVFKNTILKTQVTKRRNKNIQKNFLCGWNFLKYSETQILT